MGFLQKPQVTHGKDHLAFLKPDLLESQSLQRILKTQYLKCPSVLEVVLSVLTLKCCVS